MKKLWWILLWGLVGCTGATAPESDAVGDDNQPVGSAQYDPEVADAVLSAACSWPVVSDPDFLNVALPDLGATYWVAVVPAIPGTRVRIEGQYPGARYFSFNAYTPLLSAVDRLTDYQIAPVVAGANPFRSTGAAAGGRYVAYVSRQTIPEQREPNTLYAGELPLTADVSLENNPIQILIYRVYLGEESISGGVPLPVLTLESDDGQRALLTLDMTNCVSLPPSELLPDLLTQAIAEYSAPQALLGLFTTFPLPLSAEDPTLQRHYSFPETLRSNLSAAFGFDLPGQSIATGAAVDLLNNLDNAYMQALLTRDKSSMYIVRGKAPVAAIDPIGAPLGSAQLRYWPVCTNEILTQRFADCAHDAQVALDRDGYFTVVVSDAAHRPDNVIRDNGMTWLAWGGVYPDSLFLYRHMLPSSHFAEAIQNIPLNTDPASVMGEYYPGVEYCDRNTVEAAGNDPAAVFAACVARNDS